jgi:hypothetical protein
MAVATGLTLFLVLVGGGVATAMWTTANSSLTSTVSAGSLVVTQSGAAGLDHTYNSRSLRRATAIRVTNTGSVPADSYALQVKATAPTDLADNTTVNAWPVSSTAQCKASSTAPSGADTATLTAGLSTTARPLAVGASEFFCVRTSITSSFAKTAAAISEPLVILSYATGSWNGSSTVVATQSVKDAAAPSAPGTPVASATGTTTTTLTWPAATDNVGVVEYLVYRGGTLVGTVTAPTVSFTDTTVLGGSSYTYTVKARDAAGNTSAASPATTVTTAVFEPSVNYQVTFSSAGLCIDAGTAAPANLTQLVVFGCQSGRIQTWQFEPVPGGNVKVITPVSPTFVWDVTGANTSDGTKVILYGYWGGNNQLWQIVSEGGGKVHLVSVNSGKCVDVTGASQTPGTPVQQATCNGSAAQTLSLKQVP